MCMELLKGVRSDCTQGWLQENKKVKMVARVVQSKFLPLFTYILRHVKGAHHADPLAWRRVRRKKESN